MLNGMDSSLKQSSQSQIPVNLQSNLTEYGNFQIPNNPQDLFNLLLRFQNPKENNAIMRGTWNQQEDELLITAVNQLGSKKWTDIAKFVPTRTPKQSRERWFQRLMPGIKHEPFELWEDQVILESQKELGNRWSLIAQKLPGRSPSSIKNRWYSGLKNQHPSNTQIDMELAPPLDPSNILLDNGMNNDLNNDCQNNDL